jgi:hypothetical protein
MRRCTQVSVFLAAALSLGAGACKNSDSAASEREATVDAGSKGPALDPELAAAMAAASARPPEGAAPSVEGGPPPNGIFAPGGADREVAPGSPPKVVLGSSGDAPKVTLVTQPEVGKKRTGSISLTLRNDPRQPAVPLSFSVALEASKPKDPEASGKVDVLVRVTDARLSRGARVDAETERDIARLKGSRIRYSVVADGSAVGFEQELPKGLPGEHSDIVRSLAEAIATLSLPNPGEPVGVGAFWMATSREGVLGLDFVTYRMIKVERISDGDVTLSVNTKRYAASNVFDTPSVRADGKLTLEEVQSTANGSVTVKQGLPTAGQLESVFAAALSLENQPGQQATVQSQTEVRLELDATR